MNDKGNSTIEQSTIGVPKHVDVPETSAVDPKESEQGDNWESELSERLNSPEFLEAVRNFPEKYRDKIIGLAVKYNILHRDGFDFQEYLDKLREVVSLLDKPNGDLYFDTANANLYAESIVKKMGLADLSETDREQAILEYFYENYFRKGFYYHGFNGSIEPQIKEQGLHPTERLWNWEELDEINRIGERVGIGMILGWGKLNSQGKIFVADNTDNLYRYGLASPEWFAQFTAEGFHIKTRPPYDKTAFYRRNYDAARKNIITMCDEATNRDDVAIAARRSPPKMTPEEKTKILAFFEKYWKKFCGANSGAKVALIERGAIGQDNDYKYAEPLTHYRDQAKKYSYVDPSLAAYLAHRLMDSRANDFGLTNGIPSEKIKIISLPSYEAVH